MQDGYLYYGGLNNYVMREINSGNDINYPDYLQYSSFVEI